MKFIRSASLFVALFFIAPSVSAQDAPGLSKWWMAPILGSQALDAYSTSRFMAYFPTNRAAHEANPLMRPFVRNDALMMGTKLAIGYGLYRLANRMAREGHPTAAKACALLMIGPPVMVSIQNFQ